MNYLAPGDVVLIPFPFEDSNELKRRPALVLKVEEELMLILLKITTKNKSDHNKGIWVKKNSDRGQYMGLTKDSFIDCSRQVQVPANEVIERIGFIDEDGLDQVLYFCE